MRERKRIEIASMLFDLLKHIQNILMTFKVLESIYETDTNNKLEGVLFTLPKYKSNSVNIIPLERCINFSVSGMTQNTEVPISPLILILQTIFLSYISPSSIVVEFTNVTFEGVSWFC